jgi:hypothetical protein
VSLRAPVIVAAQRAKAAAINSISVTGIRIAWAAWRHPATALVDGQRVLGAARARVDVERRGEAPSAHRPQEAVVPDVVIAIRDEDVEDEAPEHWSRSASIASAWTWSAIASARSRSRWSATSMPALAARLASTDSHALTSWRSARDGNVAIQTVPFSSIAGLPLIRRESR